MDDIQELDPTHPHAAALLDAYAEETSRRLPGWSAVGTGGTPAALQDKGFRCLVVYAEGDPVACGGVWLLDAERAELKRMYVLPAERGKGIARQLLPALEALAKSMGAARLVLDTAAPLSEAIALYESAGYAAIERYNDNPYCTHWFCKEL